MQRMSGARGIARAILRLGRRFLQKFDGWRAMNCIAMHSPAKSGQRILLTGLGLRGESDIPHCTDEDEMGGRAPFTLIAAKREDREIGSSQGLSLPFTLCHR